MQRWKRPVGGSAISFISGVFFSRTFDILSFVLGLPGDWDDASAWKSGIEKMSAYEFIYPVGIVGGLLLATSEWWWPWLPWTHEHGQDKTTAIAHVSDPPDRDVGFKACQPQIERCRQRINPYGGSLGGFHITTQQTLGSGGERFVEINYELDYLARRLDRLEIPSPPIVGGPGTTVGSLHKSFQDWSCVLGPIGRSSQ